MRIGILRGTFDPVHAGHISFALQAAKESNLDRVYLLPEQPGHKNGVTEFKHRAAMVKEAVRAYPNLDLLELPNAKSTIREILPLLKAKFGNAQLVFLLGSDIAKTLPDWPDSELLCKDNSLVIAIRKADDRKQIDNILDSLPAKPVYKVIVSDHAAVGSSNIRKAIGHDQPSAGIIEAVRAYAKKKLIYNNETN